MPLLTGAITALALAGVPGQPYGTLTKNPSPASARTYTADFTRLGVGATPARLYDFSAKAEETETFRAVGDTIRPRVNESPFSDVEIEISETLRPRVSDRAAPGIARVVSDFLRPTVTDTVQFLEKGGVAAKFASDTVTVTLTDGRSYRVLFGVADTITPTFTDGGAATKDEDHPLSDGITPVLTDLATVQASLGLRTLTATDTLRPRVREDGGVLEGGDVDVIRIVANSYLRVRIVPR